LKQDHLLIPPVCLRLTLRLVNTDLLTLVNIPLGNFGSAKYPFSISWASGH